MDKAKPGHAVEFHGLVGAAHLNGTRGHLVNFLKTEQRWAVDQVVKRSNLQETLDAILHSIQTKAASKFIRLCTFYDPAVPEFVHTEGVRIVMFFQTQKTPKQALPVNS